MTAHVDDVDLHLEPNEASDLCPIFGGGLLDDRGWDRAFVTVLDEAPVEKALAVLGHERGAAPQDGWTAERIRMKTPSKLATEDAEACARSNGCIYVVGSQFGSKDGPLQEKRSWMARIRESEVAKGLSGGKAKIDLAALEFRLHRAVNDAIEEAGIDLLPMGRRTRLTYIDATIAHAARKDKSWSGRVISSDHPINVEAAEFRAEGTLLLGLRYPVTADGHPILVELDEPDAVFDASGTPVTCSHVHVLDGVGSRDAPAGLRALHSDGTDRFHALVGNLESTGKDAAILADHPEGGKATTLHVRFDLLASKPGGRIPAEVVREFADSRRVEGIALTSGGHIHYVVDRDGRVALRTMLAADARART